jgi:hypothetical protein
MAACINPKYLPEPDKLIGGVEFTSVIDQFWLTCLNSAPEISNKFVFCQHPQLQTEQRFYTLFHWQVAHESSHVASVNDPHIPQSLDLRKASTCKLVLVVVMVSLFVHLQEQLATWRQKDGWILTYLDNVSIDCSSVEGANVASRFCHYSELPDLLISNGTLKPMFMPSKF